MSEISASILRGAREALAYAQGSAPHGTRVHKRVVPQAVDVKAMRLRLGLTQKEFARRFGFPLTSVRNWELGLRQPKGAARVLLTIIDHAPAVVERVLVQRLRMIPPKRGKRTRRAA